MGDDQRTLRGVLRKALVEGWRPNFSIHNKKQIRIRFDKAFAKAFWGENSPGANTCHMPGSGCSMHHHGKYWEYQLYRLGKEKDKIKFLKKFL